MKIKPFFLLAAFLLCANGFSQEAESVSNLTLEQAIECALENNTSVKQNKITLEQTQRTYKHSFNNLLPSVSSSVSVTENQGFSSSQNDSEVFSTGISASLSIPMGLGKKLESIKESYKNGKLDYEDSVKQIKSSVTKSFYSILYLEKQVELYTDSLETSQNQYDQTKIKKEKGFVPELDLLQSQLEVETAKITLKNAQNSYINSLITFLNDIGYQFEDGKKVSLSGSLDDAENYASFSIDPETLEKLIQASPSVRSAKASLEQAKLTLDQTRLNTYLPTLSLGANINPYSNTYLKETEVSTKSDSWSATIALSFQLDNFCPASQAQDNIATLKDSVKSLELNLTDKQKETKTSALEMINTIEIAKETLENCRQNVELAEKSYRLAEIAYKNGSKELSSLQTVHDSYKSAKVQLNNQQLSLISSVIELKNLLGIEG